jgi:hypothetical protein
MENTLVPAHNWGIVEIKKHNVIFSFVTRNIVCETGMLKALILYANTSFNNLNCVAHTLQKAFISDKTKTLRKLEQWRLEVKIYKEQVKEM